VVRVTPAERAQFALLVEVAGTPKPGNVDRERDLPDLRFEQFLAGAVGAGRGLRATDRGVGPAFERAVAGMADLAGENTQFGALLLLVPLVRAAETGGVDRETVRGVVAATTVEDATAFYRAFDHVDVRVGDPPEDLADLDVRRGAAAVPAVRERGLTLADVMERSADRDGVAAEWASGYERAFGAAGWIEEEEGTLSERAARAFLRLLAGEPDTLVAVEHGTRTAASVRERAADLRGAPREAVRAFAADLVERGINPGTTADVTAAALFVALGDGEVTP
jgi:triphosphoribosyl-dephospho-CoA synthase